MNIRKLSGWFGRMTPVPAAVAALALLGAPASGRASDVTWTNTSGGAWSAPGNWSASAVPGVADQALLPYITNFSYTVNYGAAYYGEDGNPASLGMLTLSSLSGNGAYTNTLNIAAAGFKVDPFAGGFSSTFNGISLGSYSALNINDGGELKTVYDSSFGGVGPVVNFGGYRAAVNINGGTFNANWARGVYVFGSVLTINGGTFTQNQSAGNHYGLAICPYPSASVPTKLFIHGGIVNVDRLSFGANTASDYTAYGVMDGGVLNITAIGAFIGGSGRGISSTASSVGDMTLSGGAVSNRNELWVGYLAGVGRLTIDGGAWNQTSLGSVGGLVSIGRNDTRTSPSTPLGTVALGGTGALNTLAGVKVGEIATGYVAEGLLDIDGGRLTATNSASNATVDVLKGTLALGGGIMTADKLFVTNALGVVDFAGGTLNTKGATVGNGSPFTVGDGVLDATLNLLGGAHAFADGLVVNTNGVLMVGGTGAVASASVTGDVVLRPGSVLKWDFNGTTQDVITVTGTLTLPASATVDLNALDAATPKRIQLLTASGGISGSVDGWPNSQPVNGRRYHAKLDGGMLVMEPVPLGTVISVH